MLDFRQPSGPVTGRFLRIHGNKKQLCEDSQVLESHIAVNISSIVGLIFIYPRKVNILFLYTFFINTAATNTDNTSAMMNVVHTNQVPLMPAFTRRANP